MKTSKLKLISYLFVLLIFLSICLPRISNRSRVKAQAGLPLVSIAAPQIVTAPETLTLNVSVWLESSESVDVSNYQVYLTVDDTVVSTEDAWVPTWNSSWIFHGENYIAVTPSLEDKDGDGVEEAVKLGSTLLVTNGMASVTVTDPVLLAIVELQVENTGTTTLNISETNKWTGRYETFIEDPYGEEITIERQDEQMEIEGEMPPETSTITLEVSPSQALVGENVTITGQIMPDKLNVSVKIVQRQWFLGGFQPPVTIATVKTNQTSQYQYVHAFQEASLYQLKASWSGDETHQGSVSDLLNLTVGEPTVKVEMRYADEKRFLLGGYNLPVPTVAETINVTVQNVTDLYQWRTKIYYDPRYVEITEIWLPADNALSLTGLEYNDTSSLGADDHGDYLLCEATITENGSGYTGNATLFQFNVTGLVVTMGIVGEGSGYTTLDVEGTTLKNSTGEEIFYGWNIVEVSDTTLFEDGIFYIYIAGETAMQMKVVNPTTGEDLFRYSSDDVSVGTTFNLTIQIGNATDLYGWLSTLTYNHELINATRVVKPLGDPTYVFYDKESTFDYTMEEGSVWINNTSTDEEPFEGDGLLAIIEFEIVRVNPFGNETDLRSSLTFEEARVYTGVNWRSVSSEPGQYWLTIGEGDGTQPQRSWLERYWPYLIGIIIVILIVYLVFRRRKRRVIPT